MEMCKQGLNPRLRFHGAGVGFSWPKKWHEKWHENPHESPMKRRYVQTTFFYFFIVTRAIFRAPFWPSESGMELEY